MKLTVKFLEEKFNQFNKQFFNNELPKIKLEISRTRKTLGQYTYRRTRYGNSETPIAIRISGYYESTSKYYCQILIHEMIHYYLSYKNIGRLEDCHGYSFQQKMKEINDSQSEYTITTRGTTENKKLTKTKTVHIVIFNLRNKKYFSRIGNQTIEELKRRFSSVEFIKITHTNNEMADTLIKRSRKLSLIPCTPENCKLYGIAA